MLTCCLCVLSSLDCNVTKWLKMHQQHLFWTKMGPRWPKQCKVKCKKDPHFFIWALSALFCLKPSSMSTCYCVAFQYRCWFLLALHYMVLYGPLFIASSVTRITQKLLKIMFFLLPPVCPAALAVTESMVSNEVSWHIDKLSSIHESNHSDLPASCKCLPATFHVFDYAYRIHV